MPPFVLGVRPAAARFIAVWASVEGGYLLKIRVHQRHLIKAPTSHAKP
jgi:hypothetical protein